MSNDVCEDDGHKFEPRYDEQWPPLENIKSEGSTPEQFMEIMKVVKLKVYVHDICPVCGEVRNR